MRISGSKVMVKTILLIEDDLTNSVLIQTILQRQDCEFLQAHNGSDGWQLAKEHQPSLILLDMRLPGLDGWQLARNIKSDPVLHHIPIIALTVQVKSDDRNRALEAGCDDYIAKPFDVGQLRKLVYSYL